MLNKCNIKNENQLEFVVFCVENIAIFYGVGAEKAYHALTVDSNILYEYILSQYEILHTQSKDYIVADIVEVMNKKGIKLWYFIMAQM